MAADDYFSLFGLPARFELDQNALEHAWRDVAARVHPDRFATASAAERRVAMQWASRANEAYRQLCDPLLRARYLCEQAGVDLQTESNTAMDPAFLMQQMEWREMLDDARRDPQVVPVLQAELEAAQAGMRRQVGALLDGQGDAIGASVRVREWMFLDRLAQELAALRPI